MGKNNFAQIEFCDYKGNEKLRKAPDSWRNYCGERVDNFAPKNVYDRKYLQGFDIDFARFPVLVIETDDWGCCTRILETPDDLDKVFAVLRSIRGADGLPVVCTAFTCVSNPDYKKIKKIITGDITTLFWMKAFRSRGTAAGSLTKCVKVCVKGSGIRSITLCCITSRPGSGFSFCAEQDRSQIMPVSALRKAFFRRNTTLPNTVPTLPENSLRSLKPESDILSVFSDTLPGRL